MEQIIRLIEHAGKIVMRCYLDTHSKYALKPDSSPVSIADIESDRYLTAEISKISSLPIITEETWDIDEPLPDYRSFWLIDPLDGTKDFIKKTGEFCINIALVKDGFPVLGIVYAPVTKEVYFAEKGKGAFYRLGGQTQALPLTHTAQWQYCRSRFHDSPLVENFAVLNELENYFVIGAALKFGKVASGYVSFYPRYEETKMWDTAAGQIIIEESGGQVVDAKTRLRLSYFNRSVRNPFFIATSSDVKLNTLHYPKL